MDNGRVVVVPLVAHEPFALGQPGNPEGAERQRFAPEEPRAGVTPLNDRPDGESYHCDHAGNHDEAAGHIDSISVPLAMREGFFRRGLAKKKDANLGKHEIHERGECGMDDAECEIQLCVPGAAWIERGTTRHT